MRVSGLCGNDVEFSTFKIIDDNQKNTDWVNVLLKYLKIEAYNLYVSEIQLSQLEENEYYKFAMDLNSILHESIVV
jgi:hypothetical protein